MATEIPVDLFLDILRQSGLVSDNQMLSLMAEFGGEPPKVGSARAVADELVKRNLLTEWQADNLLQGKHRGFFLGPHRILRPLGQGGMSRVFLAEHEMMRRRCAIKILPSKHQADPDLLRRFRIEAMAIAALDHPHIVRAYDFNRDVKYGKDIDYLVMEYVEGQDLRRMVEEQGPLDYRKAADFVCQAAEGLAHAHAAGLVHRDIKPANLLVDPNGVLKILDLGLARGSFEGEEAWQTEGEQSAVGTADYVAPEQVMDPRNVDGRADIYSLGYTFYYLLTGRRPFPKSTLVELLMAHRVETPEPINKLRPDVPIELIDIVNQMTAKTPDLRLQTAKDVVEKLQAWLRDSASGREYSRISALMAAAMRAKQPGSDDSQAKSDSTPEADLELAFLDDDVAAPAKPIAPTKSSSPGKPNSAANHRSEPAKTAESKDKSRRLGPSDSGKTPVVPKAKADLLMDMVPDQARLSPVVLPQFRHRNGLGNLLTSPWLWIGLAAAVFVALLLVVILLNAMSPPKPPRVAARQTTENEKELSLGEPALNPSTPTAPTGSEAATPVDSAKPAEPAKQTPAPADEHPATPPAGQPPAPATEKPPTPETPPPAPKEEPKPTPPAAPAAEKPVDADKLLAEVKTIAFRFTPSDHEASGWMNQVIAAQATKAAKQVRLTPDEKAPNVMTIDVKATTESDIFTVVLSAELTCPNPNGGVIEVWKHSRPLVSFDSRRVRQSQAVGVLRLNAGKFFEQFTEDVRRVRGKAEPK